MENISTDRRGMSKPLQNVMESVRSSSEQLGSEISERAKELGEETSQKSREIFRRAGSWMQQNSRTLTIVGVIATISVAGYFIGRSIQQRKLRS